MSASLETSSKSAPEAKCVRLENTQTAGDIPTTRPRTGPCHTPRRLPPFRGAETSAQPETSSQSVMCRVSQTMRRPEH
eukprot:295967-Pyramimonas_sp.AAC.1